MVGKPNTWWGSHTWWAAHIHGGLAPLAPMQPGPPPKLAGWLARPPCMWAPHHVWVAHHVSGIRYPGIQVFRYQMSRYPDIQISGIRYQISGIGYQKKNAKIPKIDFPEKSRMSSNDKGKLKVWSTGPLRRPSFSLLLISVVFF